MTSPLLLVFMIAVCLIQDVNSQPDPNICIPHGPEKEGPPLPLLPEQYELKVCKLDISNCKAVGFQMDVAENGGQ